MTATLVATTVVPNLVAAADTGDAQPAAAQPEPQAEPAAAEPEAPAQPAAAQPAAAEPQVDDEPAIRLKADTFRPQRGEQPDIAPGLTRADYARGESGYYLVQFDQTPVTDAKKAAVQATGATLVAYVPDAAFKVRMTPEQAERVEALPEVGWVGIHHPAYKLAPTTSRGAPTLYRVVIERDADAGATTREVERTGARIDRAQGRFLRVVADEAQLERTAHVLGVAWIEPFVLHEKHNEYGAGAIVGGSTANASGYDGSTQIVAVADTGLGDGTKAGAHPDVPSSRITSIRDWPAVDSFFCYDADPDGAQDVDSGHGTHTSLSVLSDGDANGVGTGTAPAARLVFQAVEDWANMVRQCNSFANGYYLLGLPNDLRTLYQQAYDDGARVHSNSWGSAVNGDYTTDSANTDDFIWDNPDMTITFSAGNAGVDANGDGLIDLDSIGSPATAKNVITVGASENDRAGDWACEVSGDPDCPGSGTNTIFTYGSAWPADYPAEPIASDPSAGNAGQMAAFSSRGPTDDLRIKPDVVAPGTWVLSGYSSMYQEGYGGTVNPKNGLFQYDGWGFPYSDTYKYMGGTSMSNPIVAGGAAVVRDFYSKAHGHDASAALVKATLINSAVDLLDENNDGA
ncbi:MAG TPA: S8 family serine peptidase, partial [Nitriliruptorales bacterium]